MFKKTLSSLSGLFSITDEQAMWRVQMDGDAQAFAVLMERWHDRIHGLCARIRGGCASQDREGDHHPGAGHGRQDDDDDHGHQYISAGDGSGVASKSELGRSSPLDRRWSRWTGTTPVGV